MTESSWIDDAAYAIAHRFICHDSEREEIKALIEAEYLKCPLCKGTGRYLRYRFQDEKCENCMGTGKRLELY